MNTDCGVNVVVFEVLVARRLQPILGECATRAADGLRKVWSELAVGFNLHSKDVRRVYSQWEPTPDDRAFLATEFPRAVKLSYSFPRPSSRRDWGERTPEFEQAVDEFEHVRFTAESRKERSHRPWWQYWD